jgi:urease accessory protein
MTDLRLLQIADSAFPLGGYAFSSGLESMAKLGLIRDLTEFGSYLGNVLRQIAFGEIPFVNSAMDGRCEPDVHRARVFRWYDAFVTVPTIRKAGIAQGRSLLNVMGSAHPELPLAEMSHWLKHEGLNPHFPPTFGLVAGCIGLSRRQAVQGYLYMAVRDQICAAVRLGMLGPNEAQRALGEKIGEIEQLIEPALELDYTQATRSGVVLEIAQAHHVHLYTRLFQS